MMTPSQATALLKAAEYLEGDGVSMPVEEAERIAATLRGMEKEGRAWTVTVQCSKGERILRAGMQWRDGLYGSTWEVVEPAGRNIYSPSGFGGTPTFWCKPVGELPEAAKRWLDGARDDGCVSFCGDSIAAALLAAPAQATPHTDHPAPDATEQMLGRYAEQADVIREMLDKHAPWTDGNLQTRVAQVLAASVQGMKAQSEPVVDEAYDQIDRYLRNNLDDEDYADYSQALDLIYTSAALSAPPAQEPVAQGLDAALPPEIEGRLSVWLTLGKDLHPLTVNLVVRFARALAAKLADAEKKYGYSDGWRSPDWMDECRAHLMEHIAKGDPRDVAAYCAFLWHHGESTASPIERELRGAQEGKAGEDARDAARYRWLRRADIDLSTLYEPDLDDSRFLSGERLDAAIDVAMSPTLNESAEGEQR